MMKKGFFILFLAILFVFSSCSGDDPVEEEEISDNSQENSGISDDSGNQESSDTSLPDPDASDNENSEKNDDGSNSKPDDDKTNDDGTDDNGQATGDDDASTDSNGDSDEPQSDDDTDSGSGTTDDTDQTDGDTDDPDDDTDADADTADPDEDTDVDTGADSGEDELTVVLPYNGDPVKKKNWLTLETKINRIDVLLMIDLYSSMFAAHQNLKDNVESAIIDGIRAKIPDSAFGLVKFGTVEKNVYTLAQPVTMNPISVLNKIEDIVEADENEQEQITGFRTYHGLALWEAASGEADSEYLILCKDNFTCNDNNPQYRTININPVDCSGAEGCIGGACFRENSMPVFVMASSRKFNNFTRAIDATRPKKDEWRENANGNTYTLEKTADKAAKKMKEINAKFIGVSYKTTDPDNGFTTVAKGTASQDTAATPNYFNISVEDGDSEFSSKIAEAVKNLTENIKLVIKAKSKHVENEYGVADTTQFIQSSNPDLKDPTEKTVKAGTQLVIDPITFKNTIHQNTTCEPHTFKVTVEATGEGLVLDTREITIIVPGKDCSTDAH